MKQFPTRVELVRIAGLFQAYWKQVLASLVLIFVTSSLGLIPPIVAANVIDAAIPKGNFPLLVRDICLLLGVAIVGSLLGILQSYYSSFVGQSIMRDLRSRIVSHLHRMPFSFFVTTRTGEIMNRVSNDIDSISGIVGGTAVAVISNIVTILTTIPVIFLMNWRLAIAAIVVLPFLLFPIGPVSRKLYQANLDVRLVRDDLESLINETLSPSGMSLIKLFGRETFEAHRIHNKSTALLNKEILLTILGRWFNLSMALVAVLGPALIWLVGGWLAINEGMTIGTIIAFLSFVQGRLYSSVSLMAGMQVAIVGSMATFRRVFDYLDLPTERYGGDDMLPLVAPPSIEFRDVDFSYADGRPILKQVSFLVAPGQTAALVGPSGAGKSTITRLIAGLYVPAGGAIYVDGANVERMPKESLRRTVGMVTEDTFMFHDTIANNLRYADLEATDDQIAIAAREANIDRYVKSLPQGYRTLVGERGHKVSAGERQRLALARVFLRNPRILILDEPTNSLDPVNELAIQETLRQLQRGRTTIIVAHRLSTVLAADIILFVADGRIVEEGTHATLLARQGAYSHFYRTQLAAASDESSTSGLPR